MNAHELEVLLRLELAANRTLEWLMDRIFNDESAEEAAETLKRIANQMPLDADHSLVALTYYRGMRHSLNEDEFRWLGFEQPPRGSAKVRAERIRLYRRYRELFELEIEITRKEKHAGMALRRDWSKAGVYLREDVRIWRFRLMLRFAGVLFRWRVPGALDFCDAAVFGMFRSIYWRPAA